MKKTFLSAWFGLCAVSGLWASVGEYAVNGWEGTAYVDQGWFAYAMKPAARDDGAATLDNLTSFLLSPRHAAPIRSVALKVKCNTATPTRHLAIAAFVDGVEREDDTVIVSAVGAAREYEIVSASWPADKNVTAVRLHLMGAGSPAVGEWTVSRIYIFYGEETPDESSAIEPIVNPLATPEGVTVTDFSGTSLSLRADPVARAAAYRFSLTPFTDEGRFEHVETFGDTPGMSAGSGWTRTAGTGASFGTYTGSATTDGDKTALKIAGGDVDFLSPFCAAPITEYSFMYHNGTVAVDGKTNRLGIYGRTSADGDWLELVAPFAFVTDTSKHYLTNTLAVAQGIRQVKVSFTAGATPSETVAVDTLRVASEGARVTGMPIEQMVTAPACTFADLPGGSYAFAVQALADPAAARDVDSAWTAPVDIDLAWASLALEPPAGLTVSPSGVNLVLTWSAVPQADHYLVDVAVPGYPPVYLAQALRVTGTTVTVAVPEPGEYAVSVTACGPFGKAKGPASAATADVVLGAVKGLAVTDLTPTSLAVSWQAVPFAEGYHVSLLALAGEERVFESVYAGMPETLSDSAGQAWTHEPWMAAPYSGVRLRFDYVGEWIETCTYAEPIRRVTYAFGYNGTKKDEYGTDFIRLEALTDAGWQTIRQDAVSEEDQTVSLAFAASDGYRRLRVSVTNEGGNPRVTRGIALGKITLACGEAVETECRTTRTEGTTYAADGLVADGRYKVRVTPLPLDAGARAAETDPIDLSEARTRDVGAVSLKALAGQPYVQTFDTLASVTKALPFKDLALPHWQMCHAGETVETVRFSALGGNPSVGGVYVCCDAAKTTSSYGLGSLATKSAGVVYGLVFSNDCASALARFSLSFTARQRTFKASAKTLLLECLVTNEYVSVAAEGAWQALEMPVTAPFTAETCDGRAEYAQTVSVADVAAAVPVGSVLALRWRDPALTGSPLTNIDDVCVTPVFVPAPTILLMK